MARIDYKSLNKPTTLTRRAQRHVGRGQPLVGGSPPSRRLFLHASRPCGTCELPAQCPVPNSQLQVPISCMKYLMSEHRTWACPYNVQSWCVYVSKTHACYAQDHAPETELHKLVLEYRDLEVDMYKALDHSSVRSATRFETLASLLAAKKRKVLDHVQPNLAVCAFWPTYKATQHRATINKPDQHIPRLLTRGDVALRGMAV